MADLTITAANVIAQAGATLRHGTAGAAVTAGQMGYYDATTGTYKLADNDSGTAAVRVADCMFLHAAEIGQPVTVLKAGPVALGSVLTAGAAYYLSNTPGGICPVADLATGEYVQLIGLATSASVLNVAFQATGVAHA